MGGSLVKSTRESSPAGYIRRGDHSITARSGESGRRAAAQSRRVGQTPRPLTPITTVSSPLNLGMNLSPRRISASLRGRNRHITLMLHSAGSAISAGGWEGARGGLGARDSAKPGRRPRTAPPAARPPPAASDEASQQVMANSADGQLRPLAELVGGSLSASGLAGCRPTSPGPASALRCAPGPPARATTRPADEAMRRERASPGSDLPGSRALSHPASAPARSAASRARPSALRPALPWSSPGETSLQRYAPASSAGHPGTCSHPTGRWKDKDAWSWDPRTAVVPKVQH